MLLLMRRTLFAELKKMIDNDDYAVEKRRTAVQMTYDREIKRVLRRTRLKEKDKNLLTNTTPRAACAYLLFKIHKIKEGVTIPPARMVVSQIGGPSERASKELAGILEFFETKAASYIANAFQLKQIADEMLLDALDRLVLILM